MDNYRSAVRARDGISDRMMLPGLCDHFLFRYRSAPLKVDETYIGFLTQRGAEEKVEFIVAKTDNRYE